MASAASGLAPLFTSASFGQSDAPFPSSPIPVIGRGEIGASFKADLLPRIQSAMRTISRMADLSPGARELAADDLKEGARYMSGAVDEFLSESRAASLRGRPISTEAASPDSLPSSHSTDSMTGELSTANIQGLVHELRADLQSILFLLSGEEPIQEHLEELKDHYKDLLIELEDIPSEGTTKEISVDSTPFNLEELAKRSVSKTCAFVKRFGMEMTYHIQGGIHPTVLGDPRRIRQVLKNYTTNACKYASNGKKIELHISLNRRGELEFAIKDFGNGIGKKAQDKLFRLFSQIDQQEGCCPCFSSPVPQPMQLSSSGVGLSFCKSVAAKMNPRSRDLIGVRSRKKTFCNKKSGSEFYITIPYQPTDEIPKSTPSATPRTTPSPLANTNGLPLLIVDDNQMNRRMLRSILSGTPYRVDEAESGKEALEKIQTANNEGQPIRTLLLDVQMPNMSGPETAAAIEKLALQTIPQIIFLTGQGSTDVETELRQNGLDPARITILTKPYKKITLFGALGLDPQGKIPTFQDDMSSASPSASAASM